MNHALGHRASLYSPWRGLEINLKFSRQPNCIFKSYLKVLYIETSMPLGSLQKFEGAAGEFKGALGSQLQLISSPDRVYF